MYGINTVYFVCVLKNLNIWRIHRRSLYLNTLFNYFYSAVVGDSRKPKNGVQPVEGSVAGNALLQFNDRKR